MKIINVLRKKDLKFANRLNPVYRDYKTKCWEFTGHKFKNGYGRLGSPVYIHGATYTRAHRYAFVLYNDRMSENKSILHHCDNKLCCRPDHLYAGTHLENMEDYTKRGAYKHSGSNSKVSVFNETDIQVMRWLSDNHLSLPQVCTVFNKAKSTVNSILRRSTWRDVDVRVLTKKSFIHYLKSRTVPLHYPDVKQLNWRNALDLAMTKGLTECYTQSEVGFMFTVSRGSIRNACDRADFTMTLKEAKIQMKDYLRWKRRYNTILSLIERYDK